MSNTVKVVLGLVVGLFILSFVLKTIKTAFFIAVALGIGYFVVKKENETEY